MSAATDTLDVTTPTRLLIGGDWRGSADGTEIDVLDRPPPPRWPAKQSGLGREGGHDGLLEYTESKYVATHGREPPRQRR